MDANLIPRLRGWLDEDVPIGVIMNEAAARIEQLEAALRVSEKDATRIALEAQKVCLQNIQMKFALGYPMPAELERHILPENPFKCGVCAARKAAMALKINEKQFLAAVDREGDYECGVGKLADDLLPPPPKGADE